MPSLNQMLNISAIGVSTYFFLMLLSETFSTFTSFEPDGPDPNPIGNLLGFDPKKIR